MQCVNTVLNCVLRGDRGMTEHLLTLEDVANHLHCSVDCCRRFIRRGDLTASKVGKRWLVRESALSNYVNRKERNNDHIATMT